MSWRKYKLTLYFLISVLAINTLQDSSSAITYPSSTQVATKDAPYFVSIWSLQPGNFTRDWENGFKCGGILYSKSIILTAAHCLIDEKGKEIIGDLVFMIGTAGQGLSEGEVVAPDRAIIHPRFSSKTGQNDIAIVYLVFDSTFGSSKPLEITNLFKNKNTWLYGQGKNQSNQSPNSLRRVAQVDYTNSGSDFYEDFNSKSMIAAGYFNKREQNFAGGCQGDSGGPLVVEERSKVKLLGLVSGGAAECDSKIPTLYTRLHFYKDFIDKSISDLKKLSVNDGTLRMNLSTISLTNQDRRAFKYLPYRKIKSYWDFKEFVYGISGFETNVSLTKETKSNVDIDLIRFSSITDSASNNSWYLDIFFGSNFSCKAFDETFIRVVVGSGAGSTEYAFDIENLSECPDLSNNAPWISIPAGEDSFVGQKSVMENIRKKTCTYPKYKAIDSVLSGRDGLESLPKATFIGGFRIQLDPRCMEPWWSVSFQIVYQNFLSPYSDTEPGRGMTIGPLKTKE